MKTFLFSCWIYLRMAALLLWGGVVQLTMFLRGYVYENHQWVKRG